MQNTTPPATAGTGAGCLTIFALPFAIIGTIAAAGVFWLIFNCTKAASWAEVPTYIDSLELHTSRSSKGGSTYQVRANYHYDYKGKRYKSDRVYFGFGSDNIGSFQHDTYQALNRARNNGIPFTGYVNPDVPEEAVLIRQLRWGILGIGLLFATAFSTIGYGLIISAFFGRKKINQEEALKAQFPQQPWKHKTDWNGKFILPNTKVSAIANIIIAIIWNAVSIPLLFIVPSELKKGNYLASIGLLFPLIGLILIYSAVVNFSRWRKFKGAKLELTTMPGHIGEKLSGRIHPGVPIDYNSPVDVLLTCEERTISQQRRYSQSRTRSKTSAQTEKVWEGKARTSVIREAGGSVIAFDIEIPQDRLPTTFAQANPRISWAISAAAKLPGVDLYLEFEIPVTTR